MSVKKIRTIHGGNADIYVGRARPDETTPLTSYTFPYGTVVLRVGNGGHGGRVTGMEPTDAVRLAKVLLEATLEE